MARLVSGYDENYSYDELDIDGRVVLRIKCIGTRCLVEVRGRSYPLSGAAAEAVRELLIKQLRLEPVMVSVHRTSAVSVYESMAGLDEVDRLLERIERLVSTRAGQRALERMVLEPIERAAREART